MKLDVKSDVSQVLKRLDELQREGVPKAASRALNKTLTTITAEAARQIKVDIGGGTGGIKIKDIKAQLQKFFAKPKSLTATLHAKGKRIPIIKIDPNVVLTATGVAYRSGGTTQEIPHAFLASVKNGHRGVFVRKGDTRLPIGEKFGPSVPKVFQNRAVVDAIQKMARLRWSQVFQHELYYELQKMR